LTGLNLPTFPSLLEFHSHWATHGEVSPLDWNDTQLSGTIILEQNAAFEFKPAEIHPD
jgi:hypothetical protein